MDRSNYRIGQIVPSSNTTMETEIPAILRSNGQGIRGGRLCEGAEKRKM